MNSALRLPSPRRFAALALSLLIGSSALAAAVPADAATRQKASQATATTQKNQSTSKQSASTNENDKPKSGVMAKYQPKPVLDEETKKTIYASAQKLEPDVRATLNKLSEAVHVEDRRIFNELRDEEELSYSNIGMLWEAAVERSGTIRYAIEKLSRRDATGKPVENDSFSKRMVQSLVHLGGVAGTMWTGTPAGMIGSNMIQDMITGNPQDSVLSRVTDADMVILAKEVESLQSKLIQQYYGYRHAQERLKLAREASSTISRYFDHASTMQDGTVATLQPLLQSMYESVKQDEQTAQQAVNSSRTELSLLVGPDAIAALDQPVSSSSSK